MAYPEPIPELRGAKAKRFLARLEKFRLTSGQKKLYKGAKSYYRRLKPKE